MSWKAGDENSHPLMNKDAVIIVTIGGTEENYQPNGLYKTTIEELMKPLTLCLEVTGIQIKEIIPVYHADDLEEEELKNITQKIIKTLEN